MSKVSLIQDPPYNDLTHDTQKTIDFRWAFSWSTLQSKNTYRYAEDYLCISNTQRSCAADTLNTLYYIGKVERNRLYHKQNLCNKAFLESFSMLYSSSNAYHDRKDEAVA